MPEKETFNENELPALREEIKSLAISDPDSYQYADTRLALVKRAKKYFQELYKADIANAKVTYDGLRTRLKSFVDPLDEDERTIKDRMVAYDTERRKLAEKRALELQKEEQEKAEEESMEVAELMESLGLNEEAESVLTRPQQTAPAAVKPDTPKSDTSHFATTWKYEVENFTELVASVANGLTGWRNNKKVTYWVFVQVDGEDKPSALPLAGAVPIKALDYSKDFLNRQANALKDALNYPGVRAYPERDVRSRS